MKKKIVRLAIFGSRKIAIAAAAKQILTFITEHNPSHIVTAGEPCGVCAIARDMARELSIPLTVYFLDRNNHAAGCWEWRSRQVLMDCDHCLFIHDGKSKGTTNEIGEAEKLHVEYTYFQVK